jgi:hypothetical protein
MFYTKPPSQPSGKPALAVSAILPYIVLFLIGSVVLAMEINIQAWADAFATTELGKFGEKRIEV